MGHLSSWDAICCEGDDWKAKAGVEALQHGALQPFYHVLVDERDWTPDSQESLVAYVAQEKLIAPQVVCFVQHAHGHACICRSDTNTVHACAAAQHLEAGEGSR